MKATEPGFYWVRVAGRGVEVARLVVYAAEYPEDTPTRFWYVPGYDGWFEDAEVAVLSDRLEPSA